MPHESTLIATLAISMAYAFVGGLIAIRLKLPPLVGYLLAGLAVGPFTPGFVANAELAAQLAEIGVILLMFGVGMHFSVRDLLAVRAIALPGAIAQIVVATALGSAVAALWGWSLGAGLVFGLALSVASTVVLLRALDDQGVAPHRRRAHRGRLADCRGPGDGPGAGAPAGVCRHPAGRWHAVAASKRQHCGRPLA